MIHLLDTNRAADRAAIVQTNLERLDASRAYALNPTRVDGVATVIVGPPDSGEHYLGELWTDALCAQWRCVVAGTVGTWQQISPAVVATAARPAAPPDGYWIVDSDEHFKGYWWDEGGTAWVAI